MGAPNFATCGHFFSDSSCYQCAQQDAREYQWQREDERHREQQRQRERAERHRQRAEQDRREHERRMQRERARSYASTAACAMPMAASVVPALHIPWVLIALLVVGAIVVIPVLLLLFTVASVVYQVSLVAVPVAAGLGAFHLYRTLQTNVLLTVKQRWSLAAVAAMSLWLVGVLAGQINGWLGVAVLFFMPFVAGAAFLMTRRRAWVYSWPASRRDLVQPPIAHPLAMLPPGPEAPQTPSA